MRQGEYSTDAAGALIHAHDAKPEQLVQILADFIKQFGWIPPEAVPLVADALNLSRAEVHGVVSYYHDFRTTRPGRHELRVCQAEACQAVGARALTSEAERITGVALGESSDTVSLEATYCLGNCALGPAVMFNGKTLGRVDAAKLDELFAKAVESES